MSKPIKKLKLNELQRFELRLALNHAQNVLRGIKRHALTGDALENMKVLEESISNIETILICTA